MDQTTIRKPEVLATDGACVAHAKTRLQHLLDSGLQRLIDDGLVTVVVPQQRLIDALADHHHDDLVATIRRN